MPDDDKTDLIIENQRLFQEQFGKFRTEHREDIQEVTKKVNLLSTDVNMKFDKQDEKLETHVKKDVVEKTSLRKGLTKVNLAIAKMSGVWAVVYYLIPSAGLIAWLVFKTVFDIDDK